MVRRSFAALRMFLGPVLRDRRGVAAVFLAVSLIPLIGAVGLAVDSSLGYLVKTRMGKSLDTAGLAAGRVALDANAKDVAQQYFDANFGKTNADVKVTSFDFKVDPTYHFVTLSATADVPTLFMRVFGHDTMNVGAQRGRSSARPPAWSWRWCSTTPARCAAPTSPRCRTPPTTSSTSSTAARAEIDNLWVSVVPYASTVNIGNTRTGWLATGDRVLTNLASYSTDGWKGCVMAPGDALRRRRHAARSQKLTSFFYASTTSTADNKWPTIKTSIADQNKGTDADAQHRARAEHRLRLADHRR